MKTRENSNIMKKHIKNASYKAHTAKIIIFLILTLTFLPLISAANWDNIKSYDEKTDEIIIYNWNVVGKLFNIRLAEYKLIDNTYQCLTDCYAEGSVILYTDEQLFSNLEFKDKDKEIVSLKSHKILIEINESQEVTKKDYKEICKILINGSNSCHNEIIGTHKETIYKTRWEEYKGEVLSEGTYRWRIEGKKDIKESVDWIGSAFGKELTEWAEWWNEAWVRKKEVKIQERAGASNTDFQVKLNVSYDSDMNNDFSDVRFVNSSETAEIDYWLQDKVDGKSAIFWVEVEQTTANQNSTIYEYYGNAGASAKPKGTTGTATFLAYQDNSTAGDWNCEGGGSVTSYKDDLHIDITDGSVCGVNYTFTETEGVWEDRFKIHNSGQLTLGVIVTPHNDNRLMTPAYREGTGIGYYASGDAWAYLEDAGKLETFYRWRINTDAIEEWMKFYLYNDSMQLEGNANDTSYFSPVTEKRLNSTYSIEWSGNTDRNISHSWMFWRKSINISLEPTYVFGSEQIYDVSPPNVTINTPLNQTYYNTIEIIFNITALDVSGIGNCSYSLNDGITNYTLSNLTANEYTHTNSSMLEGSHTASFYCNDTLGYLNNTEQVTFNILLDIIPPEIEITFPTNTSYNSLITRINITYTELNPDVCWYSNDSGVTNSTGQSCDTNFTSLNYGQGSYTITTYMNDTSGNQNYSDPITFFVDSINPNISIVTPTNYTNSSDTGLNVNYTYADSNPDSCWWSKDKGVTNTTITCGDNITSETWTEGTHTIFIYINDTLNNANSSSVFFTIDTTNPVVNIVIPTNTTYTTNLAENNTAIVYVNWTASDTNLDSCWYSTNNSVNMSVTCGTNQTLSLDYGSYTITTCANDSANGITCADVTATWNYAMQEGSISFNNSVYETSSQQFQANITSTITLLSLSADLIYNGTAYVSVVNCVGSSCNLTNTIDIPLVEVGTEQNNSFYWEYIASDGVTTYTSNTSTSQHNASRIYLQDCNATFLTDTLNYTAWVEQNLTKLDNCTYEGSYDFWLGSGSVFRNYSSSNATTIDHEMCIFPNATFVTTAQIRYSTTGYITRDYYFYEERINNVTEDIKLLLLPTGDATSFIVRVIDSDQLPVTGAYVYVYRYDVGTGLYNIAEVSVTDASGATISHFEEDVIDYKVIIMLSGVSVFVGERQKIFCEEIPCSVTFQLTGDANTEWTDFGDLSQLTHSLTFDAATNIWNYTYIDASGVTDWGRLYVYNITGDSKTTICNVTSVESSATLTCDVSDQEGQTYAASYINRSPEVLLNLKSAIIAGLKEIFGF